MNFDTQTVTQEGWVIKDPAGNYVAFSERHTHTGEHCEVTPVRLSQAVIFPSPHGPDSRSRKWLKALNEYQRHIPDGTLEFIHVVRTAHITVSECPKDETVPA